MKKGEEAPFWAGNFKSLPLVSKILTVLFSVFFSVELWLTKEIERRRDDSSV